jgi:hypothetical protein
MRTLLALTVLAATSVSGPFLCAQTGSIPEGFTPIFNGSNLAGWHSSMTNHHGNTREWRVIDGALTGRQDKPGNGGILLTDKRYRDFEVYLEVKPDFGCDSGLFLRSNSNGQAYQVMLDYLEGGNIGIGGVYGERLEGVQALPSQGWEKVWKKNDWNALRARMEGNPPHIQVWLNGTKITDFQDTANHAAGGADDGMIAVQVHGGQRWVEGGYHRFRNIAVKELN